MHNQHLKLIPWIVGFGLLMESLDVTVINTAIPQMAHTLNTNPLTLKIAITSYLLSLAIFIPVSGFVANRFGTKNTFMAAMTVFILGSVFCGFSHNISELILGRIVQGIGGAMMTPVGRMILLNTYSKSAFIKAFSLFTIFGQVGPAIGPAIGGALTTGINWRWIFFVNVPIGCVALLLIFLFIHNQKQENRSRFDIIGFILFGLGAALFTFALTLLSEQQAHWRLGLGLWLASLIILVVYAVYAKRTKEPALDIHMFTIRTFKLSVFGSTIVRTGIGGIPFLFPLLFQLNFGYSAFESGLMLIPYGLALICAKPFVKKILCRYGFKRMLTLNPIIISLLLLMASQVTITTPVILVLCLIFFIGLFCSFQFTYMNTLNFVDMDAYQKPKATSVSSTFQQLSMSFGVCACAALLIIGDTSTQHFHLSLEAFKTAFIGTAIIVACSIILFRQLQPEDGQSMLKS